MKHFLILVFSIGISLNVVAQDDGFIGRWTGEDQGEIGFLEFDSEGYAKFEINNETLGGEDFTIRDHKASLTYEVNRGADPIELDLIITVENLGGVRSMLCIVEFVDEETMLLAMGFDDKRPTTFDSNNSIELKKVNEKK